MVFLNAVSSATASTAASAAASFSAYARRNGVSLSEILQTSDNFFIAGMRETYEFLTTYEIPIRLNGFSASFTLWEAFMTSLVVDVIACFVYRVLK